MRRRPSRGFTLIEVLVAAALLVILAVVIWQLLAFGIRAHRKGEATRQAQAFAQEILDKISDELRGAVVLPDYPPTGAPELYAVLWPAAEAATVTFPATANQHAYGTEALTDFYQLGTVANFGNTGQLFQFTRNRLIFTRPGMAVDDPGFDPGNLTQYVYVEYVVPDDQRNVLRRRVYPHAGNPRHQFVLAPPHWELIPDDFDGVTGISPATNTVNLQEVVALPNPDDRIDFRVLNGPHTPVPPELPYAFHPAVFEVQVQTFVGLEREDGDPDADANDEFRGSASLDGQVRVRSSTTQ